MSDEARSVVYRTKCFSEHPHECHFCGDEDNLEVHHIDGDRSNNSVDNLIPVCHDCHWDIHSTRETLSEWTQKLKDPPVATGPTKRLTVDFEDELYKEFSKKCIDAERTKSDVVRELVQDWLNE